MPSEAFRASAGFAGKIQPLSERIRVDGIPRLCNLPKLLLHRSEDASLRVLHSSLAEERRSRSWILRALV